MPHNFTINKEVYDRIYKATVEVVNDLSLDSLKENFEGVVMRLTDYLDYNPIVSNQITTISKSLKNDNSNRFTGRGPDGNGKQGLATILLPETIEKSFANKLNTLKLHPISTQAPKNQVIDYARHISSEGVIQWHSTFSQEISTVSLLTARQPISVVKLASDVDTSDSLLNRIATKSNIDKDEFKKSFDHGDDVSITRAIGNALFSFENINALSYHSHDFENIVFKGKSGQQIESLAHHGSVTLVKHLKGEHEFIMTVDDLARNYTEHGTNALSKLKSGLLKGILSKWKDLEQMIKLTDLKSIPNFKIDLDSKIAQLSEHEIRKLVDPYKKTDDQLVKDVLKIHFKTEILGSINDASISYLAAENKDAGSILKELGAKRFVTLVEAGVAYPIFKKIDHPEPNEEDSYLRLSILKKVLKLRQNHLVQNTSEIEKKIAESAKGSIATIGELETQNEALKEVENKLDHEPTNPNLLEQKKELKDKIKELTEQKEQQDKEEESAKSELDENQKSAAEIEKKSEDIEQKWKETAKTIFEGK